MDRVTDEAPLLVIEGVSKRFGATQALSDVDLTLRSGEIHALVGENGAGKSTLIKMMTGIYAADEGEMTLDGQPFAPRNAAEAQQLGVAAIYQEPSIFPDLSVAENIFIGHQDRGLLVNQQAMARDASQILATLDVHIDPRLPAAGLTVAGQQAVEIAKAISLDTRVLIMDEPTAALSAHEVDRLFRQVRQLKASGAAILFITHRLEEIFAISDRISVFRDGRHISTRVAADVTEDSLVREMVGRDPADFFARTEHHEGDPVLRVSGLGRTGVFADISFELRRGEVLGFAGLVGAGRTDVGLALFGVAPADTGSIELDGKELTISSPGDALRHGIAYLSEDRRRSGLSLPQSVTANITLATLKRYTARFGLLDAARERSDAETFRQRLGIKTPSLRTPVGQLSGGNQQKTMLAKWLNAEPRILVLDEPTRGIDVGAKADVHRFIDELARSGMGIILISSDLPEVLAMSDRVAVMREGVLRAIFRGARATQEEVMALAVGAE
ncbi:MAG TPA: sugar ABC transporter ATP-binding protein [Acidimicrobiia bacterium]|nr:sugar ABC transporter ATP-binding protein [Acidimicrobiia bacterium]